MKILSIESSCDETAAAITENGRTVLAETVYSQIALHAEYGGVVPELASRRHIETIAQTVDSAFLKSGLKKSEIDAVAVSCAPGLIGALLTGLSLYDNIAKHAGAGTLVPITGFANSIAAPAVEYKTEGFILGVGAKMFTIAGPVIVYGVSASVVYGIIYWITTLF